MVQKIARFPFPLGGIIEGKRQRRRTTQRRSLIVMMSTSSNHEGGGGKHVGASTPVMPALEALLQQTANVASQVSKRERRRRRRRRSSSSSTQTRLLHQGLGESSPKEDQGTKDERKRHELFKMWPAKIAFCFLVRICTHTFHADFFFFFLIT